MRPRSFIGFLTLLLLIAGSASACSLTLEKSALPSTYDHVGQTITYTYKVTNSGNVYNGGNIVISGPIKIIDNKLGTFTIASSNLRLKPGDSVTGTNSHIITQGDLDKGSITNVAYATGKYNSQTVQSNYATATVKAVQKPALTIVKSASPTTYTKIGDKITYTYVVTNTGNVKINNPIKIKDDHIDYGNPFKVSSNNLAVGGQVTYTRTYTITQSDVTKGSVTNIAYATGTFNSQTIKSNDATATVEVAKPTLTIVKTASPTTYDAVGQTITYSYTVKNIGNVPVTNIAISDNKLGTINLDKTTLGPGEFAIGTASHVTTDSDLTAGSITNTASATGKYCNKDVSAGPVSVTVNFEAKPALTIIKAANPTTYDAIGQTITYSYTVKNIGNVPVTNIAVSDDKLGTINLDKTTLGPGDTVKSTVSYVIKRGDLTAGSITNTASSTGKYGDKDVPAAPVSITIKGNGSTSIPEFPSMILPVAAVLGIVFTTQLKRKGK